MNTNKNNNLTNLHSSHSSTMTRSMKYLFMVIATVLATISLSLVGSITCLALPDPLPDVLMFTI